MNREDIFIIISWIIVICISITVGLFISEKIITQTVPKNTEVIIHNKKKGTYVKYIEGEKYSNIFNIKDKYVYHNDYKTYKFEQTKFTLYDGGIVTIEPTIVVKLNQKYPEILFNKYRKSQDDFVNTFIQKKLIEISNKYIIVGDIPYVAKYYGSIESYIMYEFEKYLGSMFELNKIFLNMTFEY